MVHGIMDGDMEAGDRFIPTEVLEVVILEEVAGAGVVGAAVAGVEVAAAEVVGAVVAAAEVAGAVVEEVVAGRRIIIRACLNVVWMEMRCSMMKRYISIL